MKTIKNIALVAFLFFIVAVFIFGNKEGVPIEQKEPTETHIIKDTKTIFDGLKEYSKRDDVRKKVELVEKEAFLNHKKEEVQARLEKELLEIEVELDTVRGELAVS